MGAFVAAAGLAGVLALSGCSGDPKTTKTFTPTASEKYVPPTPSSSGASPSADASSGAGEYRPATKTSPAKNVPVPKYPKAAKANTEAGQKAFIEYWFKTYNYAFETGNSSPLSNISSKDCEYCAYNIEKLDEMYHVGRAWRVGGSTHPVHGGMRSGPANGGTFPWDVDVKEDAVDAFDKNGRWSQLKRGGARSATIRIWLLRSGSSWVVGEIATVEGSVKEE